MNHDSNKQAHPHHGHGGGYACGSIKAPSTGLVKDPVCGMDVDPAMAKGGSSMYHGETFYFCNQSAKRSSMPIRRNIFLLSSSQ